MISGHNSLSFRPTILVFGGSRTINQNNSTNPNSNQLLMPGPDGLDGFRSHVFGAVHFGDAVGKALAFESKIHLEFRATACGSRFEGPGVERVDDSLRLAFVCGPNWRW